MSFRHFPSPSPFALRGSIPRWVATVLLGLQALLWGGGSIIEARAAAESLSRYSHVEDQGTSNCPPIHSHLDCLICRTMNGGAAGGSTAAIVPVTAGLVEMPVSVTVSPADLALFGTLGSRGPPLV